MIFQSLFRTCFCHDEKNVVLNQATETGLDRLKRMYKLDDLGFMSPEMYYLVQSATTTVVISSAFGAFTHAYRERESYFRKNVASTFESEFLAKRNLTDSVSLAAIRGGFKYGLKYGSFSSLYLLLTMSAANYNNKITVWEHIGTGALMGSMFRINFGFKGMLAAGSLGGFLGACAGGILVLYMKLNNMTLEEVRDSQTEVYLQLKKERKVKNFKGEVSSV